MNYPGVDKDGVFVVEANGEVSGLAIISITEEEEGEFTQANILELQARDSSSMYALIREVVNYSKSQDVDSILLVPPPEVVMEEDLRDWMKLETNVMMTKIVSLSPLLQALLSDKKIRENYAGKELAFQVGPEIAQAKIFSQRVDISIREREPDDPDISVSMSPQTFLGIIFGQINPYVAYLLGRIGIRDFRNTFRMLKLLGLMKLNGPLHASLIERL